VKRISKLVVLLVMLTASAMCFGQETTGTIAGTVKDATGAAIPGAKVTVSTPTLVGTKTIITDGKGSYHLTNLPPGSYTVTVEAKGFTTRKETNFVLEVGHTPTLDLSLAFGSESTVVDVNSNSTAIDVTGVTTQTNITSDVINYVPRGRSFQSVIEFAPAASNEPLMGNTMLGNGTGSTSPGNGSNGNSLGYSVAGGSDSENSYLVEGQETANLIGGYSHTSVPFDFIDQVDVKTNGIVAQYGGALGGVVNVIMKKGSPAYHGSVFVLFENDAMDGTPNGLSRYNPVDAGTNTSWGYIDPAYQFTNLVKPKQSITQPGFTFGGPLIPFSTSLRDKVFFFVGFNPELQRYENKVDFGSAAQGGAGLGILPFSQNTNTYYTTARIDAQVTQKIRVFGSWLYQLQREYGESTPNADSRTGQYNAATGCFGPNSTAACETIGDAVAFSHQTGYDAPNVTINTGADITITPHIVSTTRFGYYFENYHDFGYPRTGVLNYFETSGTPGSGATDTTGAPLPKVYQQSAGYYSAPAAPNFTEYNASKAIQLDQDVAIFKGTKFGMHNFNFGYQLNRLSNALYQIYNEPVVNLYVGYNASSNYEVATNDGAANCAPFEAANADGNCQGQYGYFNIYDAGTRGSAISYNHSLYGQDSWTVGRGVTIDAGLRVEKEFLPGEAAPGPGVVQHPINFGWKDKISPRIGAAWDVFRDGKMKVFGNYGVFMDQMKLNLAISSFGGQYWQNCFYTLGTPNVASINPVFSAANNNHDCFGPDDTSTANFAGLPAGASPAGTTFIENLNYRAFPTTCSTCSATEEGVAPNLKPYTQHESTFGTDYQISRTVSVEARWDRRRLDHVIEDSAIYNPTIGETFVIVNPGQGSDNTFSSFCQFEAGTGNPGCNYPYTNAFGIPFNSGTTPPDQTIPAARSYDGVEFRVNKAISNHWFGLFSYTYSHFRGNYTGLTSSDLADAGGGRNSPNNSRSFDEMYFQYNANGGSSSGLLPTDRPNKFKGYAYYQFEYLHKFTTNLGIFQTAYSGSPNTSYTDVGDGPGFPVDVFDRGKWANVTQNPATGVVTVGTPYTYRNPWYTQSDFNFEEGFKVTESKAINFKATFTNVLNQHTVTAVNSQIDSGLTNSYISPGGLFLPDGLAFYSAATHPYNVQSLLNASVPSDYATLFGSTPSVTTINSQYGKPLYYQTPRTIRLQATFTF